MRRALILALLVCLAGCAERKSSIGWAAQVPADAIRYVEQEPRPEPRVPAPEPEIEEPAPAPTFESKVTEPTTVTLWHAYRASERDALKAAVEAFHALGTPITVKLRIVPFDAFNDKVKVVVPEGRGPDLFIFAHDLVGAWSEMGFLEPLNKWTTEQDTKPFLPSTVQALVYRNALYGLPMAFKCVALFYDKAKVDSPPETFERLLEIAKEHTDGEERYGLVYEATNLYFHAPWVHAFGGEILAPGNVPRVDGDASVAAARFARSLVREHEVTPANVTTAMVSGYFNEGKAAMVVNGPWMRGEIDGVDYGVAPLPPIDGKVVKPYLGVEAIFMNRRSPQKQAAWEVMRFLVSEQAARIRFEQGQQPVAHAAIWNGREVDPRMQAFREQAEQAVIMPSSPRMQQVWTPYNTALLSIIAGDTPAERALGEAQQKILADMKRAGGGQ